MYTTSTPILRTTQSRCFVTCKKPGRCGVTRSRHAPLGPSTASAGKRSASRELVFLGKSATSKVILTRRQPRDGRRQQQDQPNRESRDEVPCTSTRVSLASWKQQHNPADAEVLSSVHGTCTCLRMVKNRIVDAQGSMERVRNSASICVSVNMLQGDRNFRHRGRQIRAGLLGSSPATGNWRLDVP